MRHDLINYLNSNLSNAQAILNEVWHPDEPVNSLDSREFLDKLEDPTNDQMTLLAFCAIALNFDFYLVYFNERKDLT